MEDGPPPTFDVGWIGIVDDSMRMDGESVGITVVERIVDPPLGECVVVGGFVVGASDGAGDTVISMDGEMVGWDEGDAVGSWVGRCVGEDVATLVGSTVGFTVGGAVGRIVTLCVGASVGATLTGCPVGTSVSTSTTSSSASLAEQPVKKKHKCPSPKVLVHSKSNPEGQGWGQLAVASE